METQTRFDLEAAITNWQGELASQTGLTPVVRRELETHLRDTVTELQGRGLNNAESFWLARQRVGSSRQLGEEFAKADPTAVWRERIFWMATALLAVNLWSTFCNPFWMPLRFLHTRFQDIVPGWMLFYLPVGFGESHILVPLQIFVLCLRYLPILLVAIFLAKGRLKFIHTLLNFMEISRVRFFLGAFGATLIANSVNLLSGEAWVGPRYTLSLVWTLPLILLCTWLIQPKKEVVAGTA